MENQEVESEKKKNRVLMGIIVALLIGLCGTLFCLYSGNKDNVELGLQQTELRADFKNLSDTLEMRNGELQQITDHSTLLDSTITAKQEMIDAKKKQIAGLLAKVKLSKAELVSAKKMIAEYEAEIVELQKQIAELSAQNLQLAAENQHLAENLSNERNTTTVLTEQNRGLSKQVEVGSLLQLTPLNVEGVKQRPNGRDRAVKNAKAAESIKISFETGDNKILPVGIVSLYVRVINPRGETISVDNQGSGLLPLAESSTQVQYSTKADIDWNQVNKKVVVYWKQFISSAGTYKVEIYQSGYLVGNGQVTLK